VNLCECVCARVHVYKCVSTSVGRSAVLLMPPAVARKALQLGLCQSDSSPEYLCVSGMNIGSAKGITFEEINMNGIREKAVPERQIRSRSSYVAGIALAPPSSDLQRASIVTLRVGQSACLGTDSLPPVALSYFVCVV
jgi:hypothetical protein